MKHILAVLLTFLVTSCSFTPADLAVSAGILILDTTVEAHTGKNTTDTILSKVTNKDCTLKNILKHKEKGCMEIKKEENDASKK